MKHILVLLILKHFIFTVCYAQEDINYTIEETEVGKNRITGNAIMAKEYRFEERVHDFDLDTLTNYLTLELRGIKNNGKYIENKGHVVRYSIEDKRVLWSRKMNFSSGSIQQFEGITLQTKGSKSYCLQNESGEELWELKTSLIYVLPKEEIAIGYSISTSNNGKDRLHGIDLRTGKLMWNRKITREYGWNGLEQLNDSTLLIAAAGLHSLNVRTGEGWDYDAITGKKDYTQSAVTTGAGVALGLLTGTYVTGTGHNLVSNVCSNRYIDSNYIYFASKEFLVKLNKNGKVIWKRELESDWSSSSTIYLENDKLFMINRGFAKMGNRTLNFGESYLAAFDSESGEKLYLNLIKKEKKEYIDAIKDLDEHLMFVMNDQLLKYDMASGEKLFQSTISTEDHGKPEFFISDFIYAKRDSTVLKVNDLDSNLNYLYTTNQTIVGVDEEFKVVETLNDEIYYIRYYRRDNLSFVAQNNQTFIINEAGEIIADLEVGRRSFIIEDKLYASSEKSLMVIDLNALE